MAVWSDLPADLMRSIDDKILSYKDQVRCRCVCSSWRSALPEMTGSMPGLLVPLKSETQTGSRTPFGFIDPFEKKVHRLRFSYPRGTGMLFRGSCHGWVVSIEGSSIYVINPLTGVHEMLPPIIELPDLRKFRPDTCTLRDYILDKVSFSSSPQSNNFVAVAIYGDRGSLAYCKRRDRQWTLIHHGGYSDFIFHGDQIYTVNGSGSLVVCDIQNQSPKVWELVPSSLKRKRRFLSSNPSRLYLVESSGGLLMVQRIVSINGIHYETLGFRVFKLDTSSREWHRIVSTGEDALFLGWNVCLCSKLRGYGGDCIYFTHKNMVWRRRKMAYGPEISVFNLSNGSFQDLPKQSSDLESVIWSPPVWFIPTY
ncbi:hypothetical protein F3Y22_tig00005929pilonHSYRG00218 [Hibiscus syriacus]|uniref:Uncharacterized protein n=1 Tax=Hibiscus syriacus TaxID=106335 RepID=A0A6A3CD57_HIBSY|nr:putative F-box protein At5g55150 [Hibiscus syriacus]KAE8727123.1 hypothetical protein F3Y22_tig00005929pilonHSYRG00218 [Hibiscus syriacus]